MVTETQKVVDEMCLSGEVKYLLPGNTFHLSRDYQGAVAAHAALANLESVRWLAWSGDPLAQYTFTIDGLVTA